MKKVILLVIIFFVFAYLREQNAPTIPLPIKKQEIKISTPSFNLETQHVSLHKSKEKKEIIEDILISKKDNDPRIDKDLKNLSEDERLYIQNKYFSLAPEDLNSRGLLVFLIGRELKSVNDLQFLKNVINQPTCNSYEHCYKTTKDLTDDHAGIDDVSLAYPQLVALTQVEKLIKNKSDPELRSLSFEIIQDAAKSKNNKVKTLAEKIISSDF